MWELENNGSISIGKGQQITMKASSISLLYGYKKRTKVENEIVEEE